METPSLLGLIFGVIALILDIYCILKILSSNESGSWKTLWILAILFFPYLAPLLFLIFANPNYS